MVRHHGQIMADHDLLATASISLNDLFLLSEGYGFRVPRLWQVSRERLDLAGSTAIGLRGANNTIPIALQSSLLLQVPFIPFVT